MVTRETEAVTTEDGVPRVERLYGRLEETGVLRFGTYAILAVFLVWTLFPVYWMVTGALKTRRELLAVPPHLLPLSPDVGNFPGLFIARPGFVSFIVNSTIVTVAATIFAVVVGTTATYGFVKFEFPFELGSFHLPFFILSTRFMPPIVTVIPIYVIFQGLGLINTHVALILAYTAFNIPFVVWMMKGFLDELPDSVVEAAMLDGHTHFEAFFKVVIPIVKPGLIASVIFTMISAWNELLFAVILTSTSASQTLPVALATFQTKYFVQWEQLTVASTIAMLPVLVFAFIVREQLIRGFSMGAVDQ